MGKPVKYLGPLTESRAVSQRRNQEKMAKMVRLIGQRGPKIDEIAREIGVFKETARYWYSKLLRNGFTVRASRNHERLGMKRVAGIAELGDGFEQYSDSLMYVLGDSAYMVSFSKTLPDGLFVLSASVPEECLSDWSEFMQGLKSLGIFKSLDLVPLDWVRNVPMWAEWFNFDTYTWDFDWNNTKVNPYRAEGVPAGRTTYDEVDLGIIEQLQTDATVPLTKICQKLRVSSYKTADWHYRNHILDRGLITGYILNWGGIRYDPAAEKLIHRKHRFMWMELIADGLSQEEKTRLIRKLNLTPFVMLEGQGPGRYFARMAFPTEMMTEALEHLESAVSPIRQKVKWYHLDQAHALWFTFPRQNYNEAEQRWNFNKGELLRRFEELVQKIREG